MDQPVHAILDREPQLFEPQQPPAIGYSALLFAAYLRVQLAMG